MVTVEASSWHDHSSLGNPHDGVALWWLGQAGFLIETSGKRLVIDPYLSDSLADKYKGTKYPHKRMMQLPVAPDRLNNIDWLLCTHGHTDHMDPKTIVPLLRANPLAKVIVPRAERFKAIERGVDETQLILINAGETFNIEKNIQLTATPASHEKILYDEDGNCLFLGYVLNCGSTVIWHSGDTIIYDSMQQILKPLKIQVALLPVNGRDKERLNNGVPGNLTLEEAITVSESIEAKAMIGHHFDMFSFNTIDRNQAQQYINNYNSTTHVQLVEAQTRYIIR